MLERRIRLDGAEQLEARHIRHVDVADDEVVLDLLEQGQRFDTVLGLIGILVADLLEQAAHDAPHGREVIDDKKFNVRAHGTPRVGC